MGQKISAVIRKYLAARKLDRITRERRESFETQRYIRNRAAQLRRRKPKEAAPATNRAASSQ